MSKILEEFQTAITGRARNTSRGWTNICCPACEDRRFRGGFLFTESGGFRYFCYNGGCEFNTPTGWEPENGLYGRVRRLFELVGCNLKNIPASERKRHDPEFGHDSHGNLISPLEVRQSFKDVELPPNSKPLADDPRAAQVRAYLDSRGRFYKDEFKFYWSPRYRDHLLIPYWHFDKIVGYLGRHIHVDEGERRFIQKSPTDYLFNQHILPHHKGKYLFVVESPLDAIALHGIGSRSSRLTPLQINLLKKSGKNPVLVPDLKTNEWRIYLETAKEHGWNICVPDFGVKAKDVGEAIQQIGRLAVIERIIPRITKNYTVAEFKIAALIGA